MDAAARLVLGQRRGRIASRPPLAAPAAHIRTFEGNPMLHELRIYHCAPGRLPDLNKRFETITTKMWEKYNIRPIGFWTVMVGDSNQDLYYLLEWKDLAEREQKFGAFGKDPEWLKARAETEKNGPLITHVTNLILTPTSYSKMQ
jgi:NIPSNAP